MDFELENCPIFYQAWWLNVVCGKGRWKVCTAFNKDGKPVGVLVYPLQKIAGLDIIRTPPFTPYLGVWLDYSGCNERNVSRYSFENEAISSLVKQLPKVVWYHQVHPFQLENWLPFYWNGFRQTTRYTYVFEKIDIEKINAGLREDVRNKLRKADSMGLRVIDTDDIEVFIRVLNHTFKRQGLPNHTNNQLFRQLHDAIQERQSGKIFLASDAGGDIHAALYMIWDNNSAYCWQLGANTSLRKSGAVQLLIWHSIKEASKIVETYNFEGSILPHIEPVFRAFGAARKPVFQIRKFGNRFLEALWLLLKG